VVSSTNKTDRHDITEILLKVALNTIKQTNKSNLFYELWNQSTDIYVLLGDIKFIISSFKLEKGTQDFLVLFRRECKYNNFVKYR
jgi:hypothetical protein